MAWAFVILGRADRASPAEERPWILQPAPASQLFLRPKTDINLFDNRTAEGAIEISDEPGARGLQHAGLVEIGGGQAVEVGGRQLGQPGLVPVDFVSEGAVRADEGNPPDAGDVERNFCEEKVRGALAGDGQSCRWRQGLFE